MRQTRGKETGFLLSTLVPSQAEPRSHKDNHAKHTFHLSSERRIMCTPWSVSTSAVISAVTTIGIHDRPWIQRLHRIISLSTRPLYLKWKLWCELSKKQTRSLSWPTDKAKATSSSMKLLINVLSTPFCEVFRENDSFGKNETWFLHTQMLQFAEHRKIAHICLA